MPEDKKFCVYRHTSPSGKVYIGITCQNPIRRWAHGHGYRKNQYFTNAIQKYGWEAFTHEILFDGLTKEEACEKEIELIAFHRSNNDDYGYNISSGGEFAGTGHTLSEEVRKKLSESKKGEKHYLFGKHVSEETRQKMRESHLGKCVWDEEHRRQISERQMGEKNHNYGKRASEETRRKMSESRRKYTIVQMNLDGEVIARYPTTKVAAVAVGGYATAIAAVCRGKKNKTAGYRWKYEPI